MWSQRGQMPDPPPAVPCQRSQEETALQAHNSTMRSIIFAYYQAHTACPCAQDHHRVRIKTHLIHLFADSKLRKLVREPNQPLGASDIAGVYVCVCGSLHQHH